MDRRKKSNLIMFLLIILVIMSIWLISYYKSHVDYEDKILQCIADKAVLYSSKTCSHCAEQKIILEDSIEYFDIVEVNEHPEVWDEIGLKGVPTWVIEGNQYPGVHSIEELKDIAMC